MLYQDLAFPKQVDKSLFIIQLADLLFESGYTAAANAEDIEKIVPKRLRFASSLCSSAHSFENARARPLISFQLNTIGWVSSFLDENTSR
jgi:hypothetical protein